MDPSDGNLAGRINIGKSRKGDVPDELRLLLRGKSLYELQKFLEEEARKGGDYFRVRFLVLILEEFRIAVAKATGKISHEEAA